MVTILLGNLLARMLIAIFMHVDIFGWQTSFLAYIFGRIGKAASFCFLDRETCRHPNQLTFTKWDYNAQGLLKLTFMSNTNVTALCTYWLCLDSSHVVSQWRHRADLVAGRVLIPLSDPLRWWWVTSLSLFYWVLCLSCNSSQTQFSQICPVYKEIFAARPSQTYSDDPLYISQQVLRTVRRSS